MEVQSKKCDQCLFSKNLIVSEKRREQIIQRCIANDKYFVCHKGSLVSRDVCCRGFWDNFKDRFNLGRIVQRLNMVREVEIK